MLSCKPLSIQQYLNIVESILKKEKIRKYQDLKTEIPRLYCGDWYTECSLKMPMLHLKYLNNDKTTIGQIQKATLWFHHTLYIYT